MQNAKNKILLAILLLSFLAVGCKTKESAVESRSIDMESMALVSASPSVVVPRKSLSGNLKLTADIDGKPITAKGTMRIKEDCGVQIGVTALGLLEIASMEFLPDNMRLIYKLGKEYADVSYADVSFLQKTGIDYKLLESVLMNRAFSPDGRSFIETMRDMEFASEGNCVTATTEESNGIVYKFHIDKLSGELVQSEGWYVGGGKVVCRYSDFYTVDGISFPHTISLSLEGVGSSASLQFELSRVSFGNITFTPRQVSSSYKKMNVDKLLKTLGNM